ncbi:MAG: hypothetical protein NT013_12700 [Planctomycetia bacterium]|nr:hypothetical protein [Planctomycetia bacterium]
MKTNIFKKTLLTLSGIALVSASVTGCGKLESGAHAEPTVRLKSAEAVVAAAPSVSGEKVEVAAGGEKGGTGSLVGRVTLKGNKPTQTVVFEKGKSTKDGSVCAADGAILSEELIVGGDGGVANVFVFLDKAPAGFNAEKPSANLAFDQKGCVFTTHAMVCQVGQTIKVLSDDDLAHNTHTFPGRNDPFNSTIKPKDRDGLDLVYKKAEKNPFPVKCDLHAWMIAYHLPLDHPFGAVSGKDGKFEIKNLPTGTHEFRLWHERAEGGKGGFLERKLKVTIKGGEQPPIEIAVEAAKFGL